MDPLEREHLLAPSLSSRLPIPDPSTLLRSQIRPHLARWMPKAPAFPRPKPPPFSSFSISRSAPSSPRDGASGNGQKTMIWLAAGALLFTAVVAAPSLLSRHAGFARPAPNSQEEKESGPPGLSSEAGEEGSRGWYNGSEGGSRGGSFEGEWGSPEDREEWGLGTRGGQPDQDSSKGKTEAVPGGASETETENEWGGDNARDTQKGKFSEAGEESDEEESVMEEGSSKGQSLPRGRQRDEEKGKVEEGRGAANDGNFDSLGDGATFENEGAGGDSADKKSKEDFEVEPSAGVGGEGGKAGSFRDGEGMQKPLEEHSEAQKPVEKPEESGSDTKAKLSTMWRGAAWKSQVGDWLKRCGGASAPVLVDEVLYGETCPAFCSRKGVCNAKEGTCSCQFGATGLDCSEEKSIGCRRPSDVAEAEHSLEEAEGASNDAKVPPFLHTAPLKARLSATICAAECDERSGQCFCGSRGAFPRRPAVAPCGLSTDSSGTFLWSHVDEDLLYSKDERRLGWCNMDLEADPFSNTHRFSSRCACRYDGRTGKLCEIPTEPFCVNQCSGNGICVDGFCQCSGDFYGADCSIPSALTLPSAPMPPWLTFFKEKKGGEAYQQRPGGRRRLLAEDVVLRNNRKRPLIYIYEMPSEFNIGLLQGRQWKEHCALRFYDEKNRTVFHQGQRYGLEVALYEGLLSSPHRTINPHEADYFYVPVFGTCLMERADDSPPLVIPKHMDGSRAWFVADLYQRAYEFIKGTHPFWDRYNGRDHLWALGGDEGGCLSPRSIWNSTILSHWGNTMKRHVTSATTVKEDRWDELPQEFYGGHDCFDPWKDVVMPVWMPPDADQMAQMYWKRPFKERTTLFYFAGKLGYSFAGGPKAHGFSMGIRQALAHAFASVPNLAGELQGVKAEEDVVVTNVLSSEQGNELANAKFCGVLPENGFSRDMEMAMKHGCIPVIIQDGIHLPFQKFLDYSSFSIRVKEVDIPNLVHILRAVSETKGDRMQQRVQKTWQRFTFHSVAKEEANRQKAVHEQRDAWSFGTSMLHGDDAIDTLLQILHFKLYNNEWRIETRRTNGRDSSLRSRRDYGVPSSCYSL